MAKNPRGDMRDSDRTWDIGDRFAADAISVSEPDEPEYIGLLDAQGKPLYRQRGAIGFLAHRDE